MANRLRVAVVGSKGRLGAALTRLWSSIFEVIPICRKDLDIGRLEQVKVVLGGLPCDYVVNCAGLTNVDYCEEHFQEADLLNAASPTLMAESCAARGIRFIHLSTDYVFGGEKAQLLTEDDETTPVSRYGFSKLEGERGVLQASHSHVILRVSWVFGPDKPSFIDGILARALVQDRVDAIADKMSSPSYTHDIAEWMKVFLQNGANGGVYHLCNSGACSWRDYGQYALDCAIEYGMPLKATTVSPLKLAEIKTFQARRPYHSAMSTEKFTSIYDGSLRSWKDAVREYIHSFKA